MPTKSEVVACRLTPDTLAKLDAMVGPAPFFSRARAVEHLIKIAVASFDRAGEACAAAEKEKGLRPAARGPLIYG